LEYVFESLPQNGLYSAVQKHASTEILPNATANPTISNKEDIFVYTQFGRQGRTAGHN
jgi:hypothetical protein